jgi:probable FeS assembly SUF system protein SufT
MLQSTQLKRDCEAIVVPSGLRKVLPQGTAVRIVQSRGGSYTVSSETHAMFRIDANDADALGINAPAAPSDAAQPQSFSEQAVWDALKTVYDPEIPVNIVDLGLVYSCSIKPHPQSGKIINVQMAMTAPGCGMGNVLKADTERKLQRLPEVTETHVEVVFDPPWSPARMSEAARLQLGLDLESGGQSGLVQIS